MKNLFLIISIVLFTSGGWANQWKLLSDLEVPAGSQFHGTVVGGLSGLFKHEGKYFALSDDRGKFNQPRIYQYKVDSKALDTNKSKTDSKLGLNVELEKVIFLSSVDGTDLVGMTLDPEGLVVLNDGSFIVVSEGDFKAVPRQAPQLLLFAQDGRMQKEITLPDYLLPELTGEPKKGIRNNLGPEGLTLTPSGKYLYLSIENVLVQDGEATSFEREGFLRVLRYKVENNRDLVFESEKLYPMSKATRPTGATELLGTGVSEIKAIDDETLLFLERSAVQTGSLVISEIKLFSANFKTGDQIKGQNSIAGRNYLPLKKSLSLDLATLVNAFSGSKTLDNMEALEFGPEVNGKKTLIILSDDNFQAVQRSLWLWIQMPESL